MNRISISRLRSLLHHQLYRTAAIRASVGGGWFVPRQPFDPNSSQCKAIA
jgi:hypothetical protein